jgi:hypothetical protein
MACLRSTETYNYLRCRVRVCVYTRTLNSKLSWWRWSWQSDSSGFDVQSRSSGGFWRFCTENKRCQTALWSADRSSCDLWSGCARFTFQNPLVRGKQPFVASRQTRRPGFNNNAILIEVEHIKSPVRSFFVIISRMQNHHLAGPWSALNALERARGSR